MGTSSTNVREERERSTSARRHGGARENAGRRLRNTKPITLRLPPDMIDEIRRGAQSSGSTMSDWVCYMLRLRGIERIRFRKLMELPPWHLPGGPGNTGNDNALERPTHPFVSPGATGRKRTQP